MRALIVGASSSLARTLMPRLETFAKVVAAGRTEAEVQLDLSWPGTEIVLPDRFDVVVNCAAHFGGGNLASMLASHEVNVAGALKVAGACERAGVRRLLHVSSIFSILDSGSPFFSSYSMSKRHGDELLQLFCAENELSLSIVRPAQIYGCGHSFRRHQPLIYALLDKAEVGDGILINGTNDALRNFIHVDDVVEIICRVILGELSGIYDCVYPSNIKISEVARAASAAFGGLSTVGFDPSKPDIPDNPFEADCEFYEKIGFSPRISIQAGLQSVAAFVKALS